jgi:hypothetical protein
MSKNDLPKKSLLTDFFCDDIENLWSQGKPNIFILLLYFFLKKLKDFFSMEINGNFRKRGKEQ